MNYMHENRLRSILLSYRAGVYGHAELADCLGVSPLPVRFVTISRQAGAGGCSLAHRLVHAINREPHHGEPWCAWDHELVEKIATESHIQKEFIEAIEDAEHTWFGEILKAMATDSPSDYKIYRHVAMTIRALATAGRAVVVGRGGVFITKSLPGGLHVRLVGPMEDRVKRLAERMGTSLEQAARKVQDTDRNRLAFYHRYWPAQTVGPESFTVTFNTAELNESQMIAALMPLIHGRGGVPITGGARMSDIPYAVGHS